MMWFYLKSTAVDPNHSGFYVPMKILHPYNVEVRSKMTNRNNLGLPHGVVALSLNSRTWKRMFEEERVIIQTNLGDLILDIQHVGSTAIPDIVANPIIDIAIPLRDFLNSLPLRVKAYTDQKIQLMEQFPEDRQAYMETKGPFIEEILRLAGSGLTL